MLTAVVLTIPTLSLAWIVGRREQQREK